MIRLIVSDLDGTLLIGHDRIHPDNTAAIQDAVAKGVHFAVASGRTAASCSILLEGQGLDDTAILAVNGCHIVDRPFGKTLAMHLLRPQATREILDVIARHGLEGCVYADGAIVYTDKGLCRAESGSDGYIARMRRAGVDITAGPEAIATVDTMPVMKVYCVHAPGQEQAFAEARAACEAIAGVGLTSSWVTNFEAMPEGVDKGTAVRELAEKLGVSRDEVLAFGDNENDLPMLRWAGHGYAMANAQELVLREITQTTGHCADGGVAQVIRQLVG